MVLKKQDESNRIFDFDFVGFRENVAKANILESLPEVILNKKNHSLSMEWFTKLKSMKYYFMVTSKPLFF